MSNNSSLARLFETIIGTCFHLPRILSRFVMPIIESVGFRLFQFFGHLSFQVYLLRGKEKHGRKNLNILFLGNKSPITYMSSILFSEEPIIEKIGSINITNINSKLKHFT